MCVISPVKSCLLQNASKSRHAPFVDDYIKTWTEPTHVGRAISFNANHVPEPTETQE